MILEENAVWLKENLGSVVSKELRQIKEILIISIVFSFLFTGIVMLLYPQHFTHVAITATGRKGSEDAKATVVWLSSPEFAQIKSQGLVGQKSPGWERNRHFLISTKAQPAELKLTGSFFSNQALQFSSSPYSGQVEIETNGITKSVDLFQAVQGVKSVPLSPYLAVNQPRLNHTLSLFLIKSIRNFFLLTCLLGLCRVIYLESRFLQRSFGPGFVKAACLIACLVIAINVLFLMSPRAPDSLVNSGGVFLYDIRGPFHLTINIDSWDFLDLGRDPRLLFTEKHKRYQGRPLYSILGFLLSLPYRPSRLEWIASVFNPVAYYVPEILGYACLNAMVLTVSILIFYRLVARKLSFDWLLLLPLTILTANEVTKAFFWTPHQQVFNLFIPLFSLLFYWWMIRRMETFRWIHFFLTGGLLGFCGLAYPAFGSVLLGSMLLVLVKSRKKVAVLLLPVSFYIPILAWRTVVVLIKGSFYDAEVVEGRLFTWVADIFLDFDAFKVAFVKNIADFSLTLVQVMSVPALVLLCLMVVRYQHQRIQSAIANPMPQELRIAFLVYYASAVPFLFLIGIYRTRLTWCLVPPLLVLIGRELKTLEGIWTSRRLVILKTMTTVFSLGYLIYWVLRKGPWS